MKLTYRGVTYDYNPPSVEFNNTDTVGKYRGVDIRFRTPKKLPVLQPTLDLFYRGVAYISSSPANANQPVEPAKPAPNKSVAEKARLLMLNHHRSIKQRQQALLVRSDAEVGLSA